MFGLEEIITHILLFTSLYTEVFLLVTFFEGKKSIIKIDDSDPAQYPTTTIIVPCFNEEKTVAGTIISLLRLHYPKDKLSIFIVDDGSTDGTLSAVRQFNDNPSIKIFSKENGGKYTALNFGIARASSELIGCLDADSFVDASALKRIVRRFENPKTMAVVPTIKIHEPKSVIQLMQKAEYTLSVFIRKIFSFLGSVYITPGPFSIFRKSVFDAIGPYKHAHNTEDLEIALRMQSNGLAIDNAHDAYVYTVAPKTVYALLKQRFRWSQGFFENALDYRFLFFNRSYGNLSSFVLPVAIISLLSVIYFVTQTLLHILSIIGNKITEVSTVGFTITANALTPNWFFINTGSMTMLGILLVCFTITLIFIGKWLSEKRPTFSRDMIYFIVLYGLLSPIWITKAAYNTLLSRKTSWR